ncbi:site-specific integrase [Halomonas saccharevitans]|uniref:Site-specific integrase n=1 Tax=Halomonas saccharevitans TaxID=416872 RepID=A0ABU3NEC1_9GAMM|nr:site-specific integrase [Halomonas saccharevitans]MDT8878516.1 site-specific integrase [Halomonas saccharevitans]
MAIPFTVRKPSGAYHFRWRIPADYQHLGVELRLSLATTDKHEARAKAANLRLKAESLIHDAESLDELRQQLSERPRRRHTPRQAPAPNPTLSALWERYASHQLVDARDRTRHQSRHALGVMVELVGDMPADSFDKAAARDFVERLADYPARRSLGRQASMTLDEIQAGDYQRISATTQNNISTLVSSYAAWLVNFGYLGANPLTGIKPKRSKATAKRKTWTRDELALWFDAHQQATGWRYWLPLLGVYTGARLEELAALAPGDVLQHGDIYHIDIHGRDGRQIKNAGSWRLVPIHSRLIELGLLDLVASRKENERLFDVEPWQGRYGFKPSKWFTRQRAKLGIAPDFHGYRHTVAEELRLRGGQGHAISWLLGHSAQSMTDHYGSDGDKLQRLPMLYELVERLNWGI